MVLFAHTMLVYLLGLIVFWLLLVLVNCDC